MSRSLNDLRPEMKERVLHLLTLAENEGLELLVYCTERTIEEQAALWAKGRTEPGPKLTYARPGNSAHNHKLAIDAVPMKNGKPLWERHHPEWQRYGALCEEVGLSWAGRWKKFREYPHAEWPNWREKIKEAA